MLEKLLSTIRENYSFYDDSQFNFEISPFTITEKKIKILAKY
jgi:coproporphyrinogen III oxidase-like Fe-S oxidoreductase